jgi:DNA-binding SARP family transcriptional activator
VPERRGHQSAVQPAQREHRYDPDVRAQVRLLGGFTVVVDGTAVPDSRWRRRQAASLVKLLALSPQGRLHRDRVVDALWPELTLEQAVPRLHKAAHFARGALGDREAVAVKDEMVALLPDAMLEVDAVVYEAAADAALSSDPVTPVKCADALLLAGDLLPDDVAEAWLEGPRERLRLRTAQLLQCARRWEDLLRLDAANERAHVELLRVAVAKGDRTEALRRYARMEQVLHAELGVAPGPEAKALHERLLVSNGQAPTEPTDPTSGSDLQEREAELGVLDAAVHDAVDKRRGAVVLVAGEAGSGKSALVRGFLDRLGSEVTAVVGGCDDMLAPRSLGPFRDMADQHPALADALSGGDVDDVHPRLLHVLGARPCAMVVEDVHWADDATLDTVRYLSRRISGVPAVLLLTFRDTGLDEDHPLRQILGGLAGTGVRRLSLGPLSVDAVRRMGAVPDAQAAEIQRVTEGNPFFVTEVLAAGGMGVPATVSDAVLARLGRLPPLVRALVQRLSVVPTRADRWLTESLADGDATVVAQAERSGMIVGATATVSFRHELARQAIESSLTAAARLQANRAVVDALLTRPEVEPSRLVHHAERSGQVDVMLAHGPSVAREAARLGAHRQAAGVLGVVLEHRGRLEAGDVADMHTQRAYSLYVVNQYEAALQSAESGVAAAREAGDPFRLSHALLVLARVAMFARGPLRARRAAAHAVEILEGHDDDERLAVGLTELARTHSNLATVGIVAEPIPRAEELAGRAVELAEGLGRQDVVGQALCYLGDARLARGDPRGAADLERAIALAGLDSRVETRVRSYVNAAGGAYRAGRLDDAERYVEAGLRVAADGEFSAGSYRLRLTAAAVAASRGQWNRAVADLNALLSSPGEPGVMGALARSLLARLQARRGDHGAAAETLAVASAGLPVADDSFAVGPVTIADVELGWLDGSLGTFPDRARETLEIAAAEGNRSVQAELCAYLRRAGIEVTSPVDAPGPWAATLAGRWEDAATAWAALGDRYEEAVVLATAPDRAAQRRGVRMLGELGALGTIPAV